MAIEIVLGWGKVNTVGQIDMPDMPRFLLYLNFLENVQYLNTAVNKNIPQDSKYI